MSHQKMFFSLFIVFCFSAKADVVLRNVNLKISPENNLVNCIIESAVSQHLPGSTSLNPISSFIEQADNLGFNLFASVEFSINTDQAVETYKVRIASMDKYAGWFYNSENVPYTVLSAVLASLENTSTGEPVGFIDIEQCQ